MPLMHRKTIPIFLSFFVMGIADAMGPMSDAVQKDYQISNVMATLLSFFVFIAFAAFSVPGGLLAGRIGKRNLLLLGLALNCVAVLIPSVYPPSFALLFGSIFLLGVGTTFLQVSGNPVMRDVSAPGNYSRNLSFAQGFKGIGMTASTYLVSAVATVVVFQDMGWRSVFPVFFVLMAVAFVLVAMIQVEETKADEPPSIVSSLRLLAEPVFLLAVVGIFLYVGAEVCVARFLLPTLKTIGLDARTAGRCGPGLFFLLLTVGRVLGGAVVSVISPRNLFRVSALLGLVGAGLLMTGTKSLALPATAISIPVAIVGVILAGLGFANIWPMLFSITVEEKPQRANELSGLMCMAISGGAIVPLVMGTLVDGNYGAMAFVVPAACFAYLLLISLRSARPVMKG